MDAAVPEYCDKYETVSGARVIAIEFRADPDKRDPEFLRNATRGMHSRDIRREYFMDESIMAGVPVFEDFVYDLHAPKEYRDKDFPLFHGSFYLGGWDAGDTLNPAFVLVQIHPQVMQIQVLTEVVAYGMPLGGFIEMTYQHLSSAFPAVMAKGIYHYGDESILKRSGLDGKTALDVFHQRGIRVRPMTNNWEVRLSAMNWAIKDRIAVKEGEIPRMVICGYRCPTLIQGFLGGYQLMPQKGYEYSPTPYVKDRPLKNQYSHVQDALQYVTTAIWSHIHGGAGKTIRRWRGIPGQDFYETGDPILPFSWLSST
jgi:hypothetical protein